MDRGLKPESQNYIHKKQLVLQIHTHTPHVKIHNCYNFKCKAYNTLSNILEKTILDVSYFPETTGLLWSNKLETYGAEQF